MVGIKHTKNPLKRNMYSCDGRLTPSYRYTSTDEKELYLHSAQPNDPASFDDTFMTNSSGQDDYDRAEFTSQLCFPDFGM
jgi:hypothetical protein